MLWLILFMLAALLDAVVCGAPLLTGLVLAVLLWSCLEGNKPVRRR